MSTTTAPLAGTYNADPVHSNFGFAVRYQGVSLFKGTLDEVSATLVDGKLEGAAKVESISIRTPEQFRAHVLSEEFFDAANHPEITFVSSNVEVSEDGVVELTGDLTIKGITRPVELDVEFLGAGQDPWGGQRVGFEATTEISRKDFGIDFNVPLDGGKVLIGDKVSIHLAVEAVLDQA